MRITCLSCAAEYQVPESRLKPGKMVRCVRCGSEWLPAREADVRTGSDPLADLLARPLAPPLADPLAGVAAPLPDVTAMDRLAAAASRRPMRPGLIGAWVATFIVLAGAVAASVVWRDDVIRAWPPSGRILPATGHTAPEAGQTAGKKAE